MSANIIVSLTHKILISSIYIVEYYLYVFLYCLCKYYIVANADFTELLR